MTRAPESARWARSVLPRLIAVVIALVAVAWAGRGLVDRAVHAPRYAVSGSGTIAPGAYVAAARRVLPPDARVARLLVPHAGGPVIVSASPAIAVYLDPPTARVLDVATEEPSEDAAIPALAAQPLDSVIARARPYGGDGALGSVEWPTERSPDWTIGFDGVPVKVADDSGSARPAPIRQSSSAARFAGRLGREARWSLAAQLAVFLGGIAVAVAAWKLDRR